MRFVEFGLHSGGPRLRLHPRVTVLQGLNPLARVGIVGMVHDLALGELPDLDAVVEIDGVELPVAEAVELVGTTADSGLIIPAENLPAPGAPEGPDRDALEFEAERAVAKVEELTEMVTALADEIGSGESVRVDMKASLTSATARLDAESVKSLDEADSRLVRAARVRERPDPWTGMTDVQERIEHLRGVLATLDDQEHALPEGDRAAVAAAVATARAVRDTDEAPNPDAAALAEEWLVLHVRLAALESRLEADDRGPEEPAARLDEARAKARAAEAATIPRDVTEEESRHLEELHDVVLAAEGRASRGMRKGSGRAGYAVARTALQEALEPLGYPTWAAFRMGNGKVNVGAEAIEAFEQSKQELAVAEQEWAEVAARLDEDTELQEVLGRIDAVLARATEIVGSNPMVGDDPMVVADTLRTMEVDPAGLGISEIESMEELRRVLTDEGGPGHQDLRSGVGLVLLGASWIDVLAAADEARARIGRDRERAEAELRALEGLEGSRVDRLDDQRTAVREAEDAVAATREAMCDIVRARLQLHMLAVTELSLAQQHDDTVTELEVAETRRDEATRRAEAVAEGGAVAELAAQVPRGQGGPVPIVVVMGEAPASQLDVVRDLPDDVQILVIGDGDGLDEWVEEAGAEVASTVEASTFV